MDLCHYSFQFWKQAKDPLNDRLMYEIIETDVDQAKKKLCKLMKWKKVKTGLTIRITHVTMAFE
jgi:hypothetical protein